MSPRLNAVLGSLRLRTHRSRERSGSNRRGPTQLGCGRRSAMSGAF